MSYKYCVVPECTNTTIKTPDKLFVSVPKDIKMRKKWLKLARRHPNKSTYSNTSSLFFCEDHFDMEKDMANYTQYKMGFSQKILMAKGVTPSKFACQSRCKKKPCKRISNGSSSVKRQKYQPKQVRKNIQVSEMKGGDLDEVNQPKCENILVTEIKQEVLVEADQGFNRHQLTEIKQEVLDEAEQSCESTQLTKIKHEVLDETEQVCKNIQVIEIKLEVLDETEQSYESAQVNEIKEEHLDEAQQKCEGIQVTKIEHEVLDYATRPCKSTPMTELIGYAEKSVQYDFEETINYRTTGVQTETLTKDASVSTCSIIKSACHCNVKSSKTVSTNDNIWLKYKASNTQPRILKRGRVKKNKHKMHLRRSSIVSSRS